MFVGQKELAIRILARATRNRVAGLGSLQRSAEEAAAEAGCSLPAAQARATDTLRPVADSQALGAGTRRQAEGLAVVEVVADTQVAGP